MDGRLVTVSSSGRDLAGRGTDIARGIYPHSWGHTTAGLGLSIALVGRYIHQDVAVSIWSARLRGGGQPQRMNGRVVRRKLPQPELRSVQDSLAQTTSSM